MTKSKIKVLMIGESPLLRGGIASVQKLIFENTSSDIIFTHIATVSAYPKDPNLPKIFNFCWAIGRLLLHLIKRDGDLIHIHISERGSAYRKLIIGFIALLFRTPFILHAHGSEFHLFYSQQAAIIKWIMTWVFRRCDTFIALSESWKKFYLDNFGLLSQQVIVMKNPVKLPLQIPARQSYNKVKFVFLGRIGERKGAFDLIRAFASLPKNLIDASELVLAGDGEGNVARSLVKELSLEYCVTILDWLDSHQRDELLAKANVFVLPSYNEGLPMSLLEAMSWALPVITTPVGGIPELITHEYNGLLVQPGNVSQLSASIKKLIQDESLRISLGDEAIKSIVPFSVEKYCRHLVEIYQAIIN